VGKKQNWWERRWRGAQIGEWLAFVGIVTLLVIFAASAS